MGKTNFGNAAGQAGARRAARASNPKRPHREPRPIVDCASRRWLAVRVASNCELLVADHLSAIGHVGYSPLGAKLAFWSGRKRITQGYVKQFPVFARYVFAGIAPGVVLTKGAYRIEAILGDSAGPLFIPPAAIQQINDLECAHYWDQTRRWIDRPEFTSGMAVMIKGGPLKGLPAMVDEMTSQSTIRLLVGLFRGVSAVEIDIGQIEKQ